MRRNSFIEMAKLHNLSGRITYISSHAKQGHLYEAYATESDRAFWRELAKCNQEEFAKSGTNGKSIEARELTLHHNKRKTNLHIHIIFAERKRLDQPEEKTATRNMFYDEQKRSVS